VLCNLGAKVRWEERDGDQEEFAVVRDLSPLGVGLYLERPLPADSLLTVEPFSPEARTLLARVIHATPEEGGWRHGCELSSRLSEEEIRRWLGEPAGEACR
jgi:hypothetical protein